MLILTSLLAGLGASLTSAQTFTKPVPSYSATYLPYNTPQHSEQGQYGTNECGTQSSQDSVCQNSYLSTLDDFCLWAPPSTKSQYGNSSIGNTERIEVAWCLRSGYGTRLIPPGAITGAHFIQTSNYLQVTGVGDLTKLNIPAGDTGGELDPHGADGLGNPIGGLVFGYGNGGVLRQYHEWTNFMGANYFCFRVCIDEPGNTQYCGHIYDVLGCGWNMPGNYSQGFSSCKGDSTLPMGIYVSNGVTSTFHQGEPVTPSAHPAGSSSECSYYATLPNVNSPAPTPTQSLFNSSASISLSSVSVASVSSVGTGNPSLSTITSKPSSSGTGPSSTSRSSKGEAAPLLAAMGLSGLLSAAMLLGASFVLVL
ncbi:uncharacterized protein EI90DRAFT_3155848 [Cantharellus anzutake]|uniref:uncharacterized protein n=1 Tax=Cantharellus anzutake TaxID=1750568 RepID=UPI00190460B3|nr:uncharacterized protein EI90DRAFT_3155848 [Cantharellus anzutake]KAF8328095.1 hypothetical protein EI90DRAFT_3155848 [Cantharellus anzutake]